jgi:predicted O-methyltransferase YrrM
MNAPDADRRPLLESLGGARSRVDLWTHFLSACGARSVAEIGVWKGEFAAELLTACSTIATYYMIDPWRHLDEWNKPANVASQAFEALHLEAMARTDFAAARRRVLRGTTLEVVDAVEDGALDFAYIDGDHTLKGISTDLISILPKVRAGGFIGGDDFCPSIWQHGAAFEPTLVFPFAVHFALAIRASIFALPFNQFLIALPGVPRAGAGTFVDLTGRYGSLELLRQLPVQRPSVGKRLRRALLARRR